MTANYTMYYHNRSLIAYSEITNTTKLIDHPPNEPDRPQYRIKRNPKTLTCCISAVDINPRNRVPVNRNWNRFYLSRDSIGDVNYSRPLE